MSRKITVQPVTDELAEILVNVYNTMYMPENIEEGM